MFDTIHHVKIQPKNSNTTAQSSDIMFLARFKINFQNSGSFPEASDILIKYKIASMARYCCWMWTSTYSSLRNPTTCSPFFAISKWIENNVFYEGNRTKKKNKQTKNRFIFESNDSDIQHTRCKAMYKQNENTDVRQRATSIFLRHAWQRNGLKELEK